MPTKTKSVTTQLGIWGSIASLIGLALYFLQPTQPVQPNHTKGLSATTGGQVINAENSTVTIVSEAKPQTAPAKKEDADFISISYMRLFGAVEVPLMMDLIGRDLKFREHPAMPHHFNYSPEAENVCSQHLVDFWNNQWRYKNASPLLTPLWRRLRGNREQAVDLWFTALRPNKDDVLGFASDGMIDESGSDCDVVFDALGVKRPQADFGVWPKGLKTNQVGFLFVILEAHGTSRLEQLELRFQNHTNALRIRHHESLDTISKLDWPDPSSLALTDSMIAERSASAQIESIKIASAAPSETYIWLLAAYVADADGLPIHYLTDVIVPVEAVSAIEGVPKTQLFRKPFLLQAARVSVPNGWFGQ
jgi:hypothetical protein